MSKEKDALLKSIDGRLGRCFDLAAYSAGYFLLAETLDVHLVYGIGRDTFLLKRRRIAHAWVEFLPHIDADFYLCFDPVMRSVMAGAQYYELFAVEKTFRHSMTLELCHRPPKLNEELEQVIAECGGNPEMLQPLGHMIVSSSDITQPTPASPAG